MKQRTLPPAGGEALGFNENLVETEDLPFKENLVETESTPPLEWGGELCFKKKLVETEGPRPPLEGERAALFQR